MRFAILFSILLFSMSTSFAQKGLKEKMKKDMKIEEITTSLKSQYAQNSAVKKEERQFKSIMLNPDFTAPNVEYNTTIFCKFEHDLMMSTKLPLKMRLGNLDYVNYLEGKN